MDALNAAKARMNAIKEKYRARASRKCTNCGKSMARSDSQSSIGSRGAGSRPSNVESMGGYGDDDF